MGKVRLYVEHTLSKDIALVLDQKQSHYLQHVMRLKEKDFIFLFNGKDGEWQGEIIDASRKLVKVLLHTCTEKQQNGEQLYLYCAIVKKSGLKNIVRQATEMGAARIQFILTEHTVIRKVNLERAKLQAIEAAEQCGRNDLPELLPPIEFNDVSKLQGISFILCDKTGNSIIASEIELKKKPVGLIIGPEGGFSVDELNLADTFCQKLSLGKRTLRVDTAAVAAIAHLEAITKV